MEAKKEAKKLVHDMMLYSYSKTKRKDFIHYEVSYKIDKESAKECALIVIDRICKAIDWHEFETPNQQWEYWDEVKLEIEKL